MSCLKCGHLLHKTEDCKTLTKPIRVSQALPTADSMKMYNRMRLRKTKWRMEDY